MIWRPHATLTFCAALHNRENYSHDCLNLQWDISPKYGGSFSSPDIISVLHQSLPAPLSLHIAQVHQ